jgi:CRISPR system Cascade subunit CasE
MTTTTLHTAWLTRLTLNPAHRQVLFDLGNAAALHRRVMTLVPDGIGDTPRARAGVLFRLEPESADRPVLLIQTQLPPDTSGLPAGYALSSHSREMAPMLGALRPGLLVRYRLLGNAVRRCGPNSTAGKWKQVIPLHGPEAAQWWSDRAAPAGLTLHAAHAESTAAVTTLHVKDDQGTPGAQRTQRTQVRINRSATLFDGTATIHDPDALRTALLHGVGRSKSYGCGLLSLAPHPGQ